MEKLIFLKELTIAQKVEMMRIIHDVAGVVGPDPWGKPTDHLFTTHERKNLYGIVIELGHEILRGTMHSNTLKTQQEPYTMGSPELILTPEQVEKLLSED